MNGRIGVALVICLGVIGVCCRKQTVFNTSTRLSLQSLCRALPLYSGQESVPSQSFTLLHNALLC